MQSVCARDITGKCLGYGLHCHCIVSTYIVVCIIQLVCLFFFVEILSINSNSEDAGIIVVLLA